MKKIQTGIVAAALVISSVAAWAQQAPSATPENAQRGAAGQASRQNAEAGGSGHGSRGQSAQPTQKQKAQGQQASHRYQKGETLPKSYRGSQHAVSDWKSRGLSQPPKGHQWVKINGEYILVAVATGVIASVLLHN